MEQTGLQEAAPVSTGENREQGFKPRLGLGLALVGLTGILYGTQAIIGKWAYANGATPVTALTLRSVVASGLIWLLVAYFRPVVRLPLARAGGLALLGLVFAFSALAYFVALQRIAVGTAVLIVFIYPGLVVLGAFFFFRERLSGLKILALFLALAGCALTVDPFAVLAENAAFDWLGVLLALVSAACNAAYALLGARFGRNLSGLTLAAYSMPANALFFLGWSLLEGGFAGGMSLLGWLLCLSLGLFTGVAWTCFFVGLPHIGPSRASIVITSEPATAVILGILLLGEPVSLLKLLGGGLILAAIYLLRN